MAVLEARNLTVSVQQGGAPVAVLRDISFSIAAGQVLGLVGESGAGKSMISRVIARDLPDGFSVSGGAVTFAGTDLLALAGPERQRLLGDRIAFIPQEPLTALNPVLTIRQQFGEHLSRLGVEKPARDERMTAALADVQLREPAALLERYPFQLSGGMCQRVLIAMAFASKPALIIADEPTTALDVTTQSQIVRIMRRMQRDNGTAMLFITHNLRLAPHVCDNIMVLYAGDGVERGPAWRVTLSPRHPYTRALCAAIPPLGGERRALAALPDQMPGISAFASLQGCRFAPRCAVSDAGCAERLPALAEIEPGHAVRCSPHCLADSEAAPAAPALLRQVEPTGQTPVLRMEQVSRHYAGRRSWLGQAGPGTDAMSGVSLEVLPGEFVGIVGESGSGKSTLARLAMGLEPPTGGRVLIGATDVTRNEAAARRLRLDTLQMVFQDPQSALNPRRAVLRLITQSMEAKRRRASAGARLTRAHALLSETGLSPELLTRFPAQLSGGQKQRVNIARALCVTPELLVADEIVSGLDVSVQAQILNLLLALRERRSIALLFISHDLAVVRYLCSRVLVMHRGLVVEQGRTDDVFKSPQHAYTRALLAAVPPDRPDADWPPEPGAPALEPVTGSAQLFNANPEAP